MRRKSILVLILLLVIGFAAISTTLIINGIIGISTSQEKFSIIFTSAKLDNVRRMDFIDDTKKKIVFETNTLTDINQETNLEYEVTNTSRIYDGEVIISCKPVNNEYVAVDYQPKSMIVEAGHTKVGNIKAWLKKTSVDEGVVTLECTLNARAIERNTLGDEYVNPRGRIIMAYSKENKIWQSSIRDNVTRVVFENQINPHETTEDLIFDMSESRDKSVMAYAVANGESTETENRYDLYIQANGNVIANEDSSNLFYNFKNLKEIVGLEYYDTSIATNMRAMFRNCKNLAELDLSNFDTTNVTNMWGMFAICKSLEELDLSNFDTSNVTNMYGMFNMYDKNESMTSKLRTLKISNFKTGKVTNMKIMFQACMSLEELDLSTWDTSNVEDMGSMFSMSDKNKNIISKLKKLNVSNFKTGNVINMKNMFLGCQGLEELDLSTWDTSNVTNMQGVFSKCTGLEELDLNSWNTSKVTNMHAMFSMYNAGAISKLRIIKISDWDTRNVTDMKAMFQSCISLEELDLNTWNTSKVTDMSYMFNMSSDEAISKLKTLNINNWDLSSLNNTYAMFQCCVNVTATITIKGTNVTTYGYMFYMAATEPESSITINYTADAFTLVDNMINNKSANSNIVKGTVVA